MNDRPTCPSCGEPVLLVTTHGVSEHRAHPCGCRIADPRVVDGSSTDDASPAVDAPTD